jgi:hypothetical protein
VEISGRLNLRDVTQDAEDYWEWVIGTLGASRIDITRTHTVQPQLADTRIFLAEQGALPESLIAVLVGLLQSFVSGSIYSGQWRYRSGNDFDQIVLREFLPAGS